MGSLTTHVLDVAGGRPASGVHIVVKRMLDGALETLVETVTNSDGRCDRPLVAGADFVAGRYQIVFAMGDYYAAGRATTESPPFLEDVTIQFGVAHPDQHYHVPLLASPYGYTTYRGS